MKLPVLTHYMYLHKVATIMSREDCSIQNLVLGATLTENTNIQELHLMQSKFTLLYVSFKPKQFLWRTRNCAHVYDETHKHFRKLLSDNIITPLFSENFSVEYDTTSETGFWSYFSHSVWKECLPCVLSQWDALKFVARLSEHDSCVQEMAKRYQKLR